MQVPFHVERVPGAESAVIEDAKLLQYALNLDHHGGRFVKENPDSADNWEAIITIRRRDRDDVADICTVWEVREEYPTRLITVYPA